MKANCWEFKKCGREPGGKNADELGVCIAATDTKLNGVHGGTNGGRACWILKSTLCGGQVQNMLASKLNKCLWCEFYKKVLEEEEQVYSATELYSMVKKP